MHSLRILKVLKVAYLNTLPVVQCKPCRPHPIRKRLDYLFVANGSTRNLNTPRCTSSSVSTKSKKSLGSLLGTVPNNGSDSHGGSGASVKSRGNKQAMIPVVQRVCNVAKGNGTPIKPATNRHSSESYMTSKIEVTFTPVLTLPEGFGNSFFAKPTNEPFAVTNFFGDV
jgi:hypothetical protein